MKKNLFVFFLGFVICGAILKAQTLDEAILNAAVSMSRDLPANATVAVIYFSSSSESLSDYVINELHGAILRYRRVIPVKPDQSQLQSIHDELSHNAAGELNGESSLRIGQLLDVQYLVAGSMELVDSESRIRFYAFDTDAEIQAQYAASLNQYDDTSLASLADVDPVSASPEDSVQTQDIEPASASQDESDAGISRTRLVERNPRFNSIGASLGVSASASGRGAAATYVVIAIHATYSFFPYTFIEGGLDFGLSDSNLPSSYHPYLNINAFLPFNRGGWYAGIGYGVMFSTFTFYNYANDSRREINLTTHVFNVSTGFLFWNWFRISYTQQIRIGGTGTNFKISLGPVWRFK